MMDKNKVWRIAEDGTMAERGGVRQGDGNTCPGCGQEVTTAQGFTECGGEGNGCCDVAAFAFDRLLGRSPVWEGDGPQPDEVTLAAVARFHRELV